MKPTNQHCWNCAEKMLLVKGVAMQKGKNYAISYYECPVCQSRRSREFHNAEMGRTP